MRERGILRPGRGHGAEIDRVSLGAPSSFLRGLDLDLGPSVSVSIPSGQSSALEVARSLLDLGRPPEAIPAVDIIGAERRPGSSMAVQPRSPMGYGVGLPGARGALDSGPPR